MGGGAVVRYMSGCGGKDVSNAALIFSVVPFTLKIDDNPLGTPKAIFDEMTAGIKEDRAKFFASFFRDFYGVSLLSHPVSETLIENSNAVAMQAGLKGTLAFAAAFATTDFQLGHAHFTAPTLIIHGTEDKTVSIEAAGRAAAKSIATATLIEYEGAPHGLFATQKQRSTKDLLDFIKA